MPLIWSGHGVKQEFPNQITHRTSINFSLEAQNLKFVGFFRHEKGSKNSGIFHIWDRKS
jgi:hypothetical protein